MYVDKKNNFAFEIITEMNVSQIAATLGFDTANYFIRLFKKHTGFTPMNYRDREP